MPDFDHPSTALPMEPLNGLVESRRGHSGQQSPLDGRLSVRRRNLRRQDSPQTHLAQPFS
jgi:hypothetical protein